MLPGGEGDAAGDDVVDGVAAWVGTDAADVAGLEYLLADAAPGAAFAAGVTGCHWGCVAWPKDNSLVTRGWFTQ